MVFWEKLYYGPIRNGQGLNLKEYLYLRGLYYYNIRNKEIRARNRGPRNLKTY